MTTHLSQLKSQKGSIKRFLLYTLSAVALGAFVLWSVYGDKTNPPRLTTEQFTDIALADMTQVLVDAAVQGGAPGAVIYIQRGDKTSVSAAGVADKSTSIPMPTDALLRIGSVSKVYTATVILRLAEQSFLNLDAPIKTYLPESVTQGLANGDKATVRQLLNHTGGIPDYYDIASYFSQDWTTPLTLERTLPIAKKQQAEFSAGERYAYSNMGYILLGEIAEIVTGKPLSTLLDEWVFSPLALQNTLYNVKHPHGTEVHGYGTYLRPWADTYELWEHSGPDAGIVASAEDTATFLSALVYDSGGFSSMGQFMLADLVTAEGGQLQGLGLMTLTSKKDGTRLIGHTGSVFGYQTFAFAWPEKEAVFVMQLTCDCAALTSAMLRNTVNAVKALP